MRVIMSLAVFLPLIAACGGGKDPTGTGGNTLVNGTFTAMINGSPYSPLLVGVDVGNKITFVATGGGTQIDFQVNGIVPGSYLFGGLTLNIASLTLPGSLAWHADPDGGSGTVIITTITASRVVGSFNFTMAPYTSSGATGNRSVSGSFDLTY